jgi:ornithine carbamoyltransferase
MPKDVLRIADLPREQLLSILTLAEDLKQRPLDMQHELAGGLVVLYLAEASTRTRVTFSNAAARVGATVVVVGPAEMARRGGTVDDIAEAVSGYASAIVARADGPDLARLAAAAGVPVVNGLSDRHNPGQALADLMTLRECFGSLDDRRIAYIGDGTSVCHSLIEACAVTGIDLRLVSPPGRAPDAEVLGRAGALAARTGTELTVTYDAAEAVDGVDAIYVGPWLAGTLPDEEHAAMPSYPVTAELLDRAAPGAIVMHSQPRRFGIADGSLTNAREVLRDPRSRGLEQAGNRLHAAAALLVALHRGHVEGKRSGSSDAAGTSSDSSDSATSGTSDIEVLTTA